MPLSLAFGPAELAADSSQDFGPYTVAEADTVAKLTVERDITDGLDSHPEVTLEITIFYSTDGGTTWTLLAGAGFPGGVQTQLDRQGVLHTLTTTVLTVGVDLVLGLPIKGNVTVTGGGPLAVSGSIVVT
jgi:hypothetical protein